MCVLSLKMWFLLLLLLLLLLLSFFFFWKDPSFVFRLSSCSRKKNEFYEKRLIFYLTQKDTSFSRRNTNTQQQQLTSGALKE
jgi:hypothetical protein